MVGWLEVVDMVTDSAVVRWVEDVLALGNVAVVAEMVEAVGWVIATCCCRHWR